MIPLFRIKFCPSCLSVISETKYLILQIKEGKVYSVYFCGGFRSYSAGSEAGWMAQGQQFMVTEDSKSKEQSGE